MWTNHDSLVCPVKGNPVPPNYKSRSKKGVILLRSTGSSRMTAAPPLNTTWSDTRLSMCLTGNQSCASPTTVSMWCWAAWTGIQSTRFTWWRRISRASRSLASSPTEPLRTPLPSQLPWVAGVLPTIWRLFCCPCWPCSGSHKLILFKEKEDNLSLLKSWGPESFAFYAMYDPCAVTCKVIKIVQDIDFMTLLQGAQYLHHSQIWGGFRLCWYFCFHLFSCCIWIVLERGTFWKVLSMLQMGLGCSVGRL